MENIRIDANYEKSEFERAINRLRIELTLKYIRQTGALMNPPEYTLLKQPEGIILMDYQPVYLNKPVVVSGWKISDGARIGMLTYTRNLTFEGADMFDQLAAKVPLNETLRYYALTTHGRNLTLNRIRHMFTLESPDGKVSLEKSFPGEIPVISNSISLRVLLANPQSEKVALDYFVHLVTEEYNRELGQVSKEK